MFGKHFASMYEGSMYGAGPIVFAIMGYVIAKSNKSRVELNPKVLADTLGCTEEEAAGGIAKLCRPDRNSRNQEQEGRRLVKEGTFQYFVVSWEKYRGMRDEEERRIYNRVKQREYRALKASQPLPGEKAFVQAVNAGASEGELDRLAAPKEKET